MKSTRRTLLKSLGIGAGALLVHPLAARLSAAAAQTDRHFIFAYMNGGWDTLMCLDPRDPSKFRDADVGKTGIQLDWGKIGSQYPKKLVAPSGSKIQWGPMVGKFAKHFDVSCVVNGIAMDTVTHQVGMRYFLTGKLPRGLNANGSSVPTYIVAAQGDNTTVPNLVSRVETYNEKESNFASGLAVNGVNDLITSFADGTSAYNGGIMPALEAHWAAAKNCDPVKLDTSGVQSLIKATRARARTMVKKNYGREFSFNSGGDPAMVAIKKRYGVTSMTAGPAQAAMAFQALTKGVAQCVTFELANGLDTHGSDWRYQQPQRLLQGFNALSVLVDDLKKTAHPKGGKYIDKTTIVVFSEFGRQGTINGQGGRDHSVHNSCLVIGAGVPHNTVVGATTPTGGLDPVVIDKKTGKPTKTNGVRLTPAYLFASLLKGAGYKYDIFRVDGLPCLMA